MKDPVVGVKIGCFGGFWGDSMSRAVGQFLRSPEAESIDYLVSDYLAEVTMCILAKKKQAALRLANDAKARATVVGNGGSIDDFAKFIWRPFGRALMDKGIKVVVNAGGLDPLGLKAAIEALSIKMFPDGHRPIVAAVIGDDLHDIRSTLPFASFALDGGATVDSINRPPTFPDGSSRPLGAPLSTNAYLGCGGIVAALRAGAHVVVTGRVVDSALVLGPLVHEHGWKLTDYDRLAAGTLAGHIIECGAQSTGGNFTDWALAMQLKGKGARLFENIGFPLVEVKSDGTFVVTKPSGTGGIVSRLSVAEQMVYEIGDSRAYHVADVVCDFSQVTLTEARNRVEVRGVRGTPPSQNYKVSATYTDGYMAHYSFCMIGPAAYFKARAVAESILRRAKKDLEAMGKAPFIATRVEYIGAGEFASNRGGDVAMRDATEVVARISGHHQDRGPLAAIAAHIPSASTGMAPGLFALSTARAAPSAAVALRSALIPVNAVPIFVRVTGSDVNASLPPTLLPASPAPGSLGVRRNPVETMFAELVRPVISEPTVIAPLYTVACCRSGDKANAANVGVVCRDPSYLMHIAHIITPEKVREHLSSWFDDTTTPVEIQRFLLPGVGAMNFVLPNVLGGGGAASLKVDKQGKCIGSILSGLKIELPKSWVDAYERTVGEDIRRAIQQAKL